MIILLSWNSGAAAAPFMNLDFELANTNNIHGEFPTPGLVSGWSSPNDLLP